MTTVSTEHTGSKIRKTTDKSYIIATIALVLFAIPCAATQYKVPTILTDLISQFGMTASFASWLITIFTVTGVIMALPAGPLSERIGPKRALLASGAVMVIGTVIGAFCSNDVVLLTSRAVEGIGFAVICVAGPLVIQRCVPKERIATATGIWEVWIPIGCVLGEVATPSVYSSLGFVGAWLVYAAMIVIFGILMAILIKAPSKGLQQGDVNEIWRHADADETGKLGLSDETGKLDHARGSVKDALSLNYVLLLISWLTFNILNFALMSYGPTYLQGIGISASLSGVITTLPMALMLVAGPIGGALIDRLGHAKLFNAVGLVGNAAGICLMFTQRGALLWIAALIIGLLGQLAPTASLCSVKDVIGDARVLPIGIAAYMFVQCLGDLLGGLLSPLLLGSALDNWALLTISLAVIGGVGILCAVRCHFR